MKKARTQSEALLQAIFGFTGVALGMTDRSGRWLKTNDAFSRLLGYTQGDLSVLTDRDITHPDDRELTERYIAEMAEGTLDCYRIEKRYVHKNGDTVWADVSLTDVRDDGGGLSVLVVAVIDITERKRVQERLLTSQKMEAIGMLAGGIAHDFNNTLATILGYASFLKGKATKDDLFFGGLEAIEDSAERAAGLTSQILDYSRHSKMEIETFSINLVIAGVNKLMQKTFDKSITIVVELDESISNIDADMAQIRQMALNLCIHARDAMPKGGVLTIKTFMLDAPDDRIRSGNAVPPGRYVCMMVSDTGTGTDMEAQRQILEPSLSGEPDKETGGFALSVVYEVVKRHGGWIDVNSRIGAGTEFTLLLPASQEKRAVTVVESVAGLGGTEMILVIDDEIQIVQMIHRLLTDAGYQVLDAYSGADGIRIFKEKVQEIDLVLLDIVMPGMGGEEVMSQLLKLRPDTKVLLVSGFSEQDRHQALMNMGALGFVAKPFNIHELLKEIRSILE
jgi:two-component system, cell cycle sensor histidine kinase and response regulator CckA